MQAGNSCSQLTVTATGLIGNVITSSTTHSSGSCKISVDCASCMADASSLSTLAITVAWTVDTASWSTCYFSGGSWTMEATSIDKPKHKWKVGGGHRATNMPHSSVIHNLNTQFDIWRDNDNKKISVGYLFNFLSSELVELPTVTTVVSSCSFTLKFPVTTLTWHITKFAQKLEPTAFASVVLSAAMGLLGAGAFVMRLTEKVMGVKHQGPSPSRDTDDDSRAGDATWQWFHDKASRSAKVDGGPGDTGEGTSLPALEVADDHKY